MKHINDYSDWTISEILEWLYSWNCDIDRLGYLDIQDFVDDYRSTEWLVRELRKLHKNRIYNALNPKPGRKKAPYNYVQKTKGRSAADIHKGSLV